MKTACLLLEAIFHEKDYYMPTEMAFFPGMKKNIFSGGVLIPVLFCFPGTENQFQHETTVEKKQFEFSINTDFNAVISQCKSITRRGQDGTWITEEMRNAYNDLHHAGYAA